MPPPRSKVPCGSSPLARGTLEVLFGHKFTPRLIPARAGNTLPAPWMRKCAAAHPRSRGEHSRKPAIDRLVIGSSPLARGTPTRRIGAARRFRLIPARAGNTKISPLGVLNMTAHPRSRGEHCSGVRLLALFAGSSPLARGTLRPIARDTRAVRLIPARAGNTLHGFTNHRATPGSSPLARGTPQRGETREPGRRLIPARAGNTWTVTR